MKKIFSFFIILLFVLYWVCTIIFTTPDNYVNINFLEYHSTFERFFYQKWGFFAPPPQFNEYLYYTYYSDGKDSLELKTFEIIEPIIHKKQLDAPFNSSAERLDYIFSSALINISDDLANSNSGSLKDSLGIQRVIKQIENGYSFALLKNYAKLVAKNNNIDSKTHKLQISIFKRDIKKFSERNDTNNALKPEELLFRSNIISF